jgi:hypothetical protein
MAMVVAVAVDCKTAVGGEVAAPIDMRWRAASILFFGGCNIDSTATQNSENQGCTKEKELGPVYLRGGGGGDRGDERWQWQKDHYCKNDGLKCRMAVKQRRQATAPAAKKLLL